MKFKKLTEDFDLNTDEDLRRAALEYKCKLSRKDIWEVGDFESFLEDIQEYYTILDKEYGNELKSWSFHAYAKYRFGYKVELKDGTVEIVDIDERKGTVEKINLTEDLENEFDLLTRAGELKCKLSRYDMEEAEDWSMLLAHIESIYNILKREFNDNIKQWRFYDEDDDILFGYKVWLKDGTNHIVEINNGCVDIVEELELTEEAETKFIIVAITKEGTRLFYDSVNDNFVTNAQDATIYDKHDVAIDDWHQIDKTQFKRVFVPNYDPTLFESVNRSVTGELIDDEDIKRNHGYRQDNLKDSFEIGDRVAHRWADEYNVGTIKDIRENEGIQYQVEWDYSDGDYVEWLYGDEITHWVDVNEELTEASNPYFQPYGYRDAAKVLNGKAPEYYYHLKEIEMDRGDGEKLASYARKIGLDVIQDPNDDPDYPTFYILGKYHWNDYFYPYPSNWEPTVDECLSECSDVNESVVDSETCCICNEPINGYGNNAEPVCSGRCCDKCNLEKVIPARLDLLNNSDDDYETDYRYYVYANEDDVVGDEFEYDEDAIEWAKENGYPIVKIHNYYRDERGKLQPDGYPEVIWMAE